LRKIVVTSCETARAQLQVRFLGLGVSVSEIDDLEEHLASCPGCSEEASGLERLASALPPPPALRERVLVATRTGRPLPSFAGALARLFDWPVDKAREVLVAAEGESHWRPGFVPGNRLRPLAPGPAHAGALAMLLHTDPGVVLPDHRHGGAERTFVLQGGYRDSAGVEVWAGEYQEMTGGSHHAIHVLPGEPCVAAVLCRGGLVAI
jgi:hypothetical protein